jgi:hypothetical protein
MTNARVVCAAVGLSVVGFAHADPIEATFESLVHGEIITSQFADVGMSIQALNFQLPGAMPIAFDTQFINTADPDLQGPPWAGGNLAPNTILGNVIIVPENMIDADNDGIVDDPDDEGARPAGELSFAFDEMMTGFGFDVLDIEGVTQESTVLEFFRYGDSMASISFDEFIDPLSAYYDSTIEFGNNTANRVQPITADMLGIDGFTSVLIHLGGSSAFDNIVTIPAPGSAAILALGGIAGCRRRRS